MTPEQKAALDLAVLNLKTHGDDQLLSAVQPLIDFYEARRTVSGQEAVGVVGTMPGTEGFTMACFEADHVPAGTKLYAAPIPAMEPK